MRFRGCCESGSTFYWFLLPSHTCLSTNWLTHFFLERFLKPYEFEGYLDLSQGLFSSKGSLFQGCDPIDMKYWGYSVHLYFGGHIQEPPTKTIYSRALYSQIIFIRPNINRQDWLCYLSELKIFPALFHIWVASVLQLFLLMNEQCWQVGKMLKIMFYFVSLLKLFLWAWLLVDTIRCCSNPDSVLRDIRFWTWWHQVSLSIDRAFISTQVLSSSRH